MSDVIIYAISIIFGIGFFFGLRWWFNYSHRKADREWSEAHPLYDELLAKKHEAEQAYLAAQREWYYEPKDRIDSLMQYKQYIPTTHHAPIDKEIHDLREYIFAHEGELEQLKLECQLAEEQFENYLK